MLALYRRFVTALGVLLLSFAGGLPAAALQLPPGVTKGPSVEGTTEYLLQNGLKVLLTPDASKPTTTVNMTYLVGSRHENYGETGMAHLLEHMLFRGTPSLPNALAEFSRRGLRANGSTSADRTNYYASFAADPETLEWYIRWQADAMVNATILREDLDAEMTVVRNEMEAGENNPFRILMQKMRAAAFQWHSYGKDTIGARSDVEMVEIEQLRAFYRTYYQPDNAVLIVAGKFDPQSVLNIIADAFNPIPKPERRLPREYTVEPVQDGERRIILRRHGGSPYIATMYHIPAASNREYTWLDLGVNMLSDMPSGRLYHDLVDKQITANVFGFASSNRYPGYALFGAQLENDMDPFKALDAMNASIASLAEKPFEQEQLDRIRNKWLTDWAQTYADPVSLAGVLSEAVAAGDWRLFFLHRDQVEQAELKEVQDTTRAYLVSSNRTEGLYLPTESPVRAPLPEAVDVDEVLSDYKGKEGAGDVDAFNPAPENIDAQTLREPLQLANGEVQLALLPKPTRGDRVQAILLVQFADADKLKGKRVVSNIVPSMLDRGTTSMSRQEIEDRFNALQAEVSFGGGAGNLTVSMSTTGENLPELVATVIDVVRNANFPEKELAEYQRQAAASIRSSMDEPSSLASQTLSRHANHWPEDDIRYVPTFEQMLKEVAAVKRQDLVQFHDQFYGAGTIRFSAVGAFEPDAVKEALAKGLEGWKKAPPYTRVSDPYRPVAPELFRINTPDKANAFYLATAPLKLQDTDPRFTALYLANYLLGSSENSKLWNRIRVQEGLSYNVRSEIDASSYEESGEWTFYAIHAPENSRRLQESMTSEIRRVLEQGFSAEEVEDGKKALLNLRRLARTRDNVLASAWINYLQAGRTFEWSAKVDRELAALTADDVNKALREVLKPEQLSIAIAADESRQKKTQSP